MSDKRPARRKLLQLAAAAAALPAMARRASAQSYPSRPITIVVPYGAGGPSDIVARLVADAMRAAIGQAVVIENVAGASGTIGVGRVARAAPDGYTLSMGGWATHVLNGATLALPYDPLLDFEPVVLMSRQSLTIAARNSMPASDLTEFIAWLKANPGQAMQGTTGAGGISAVGGLLFQRETGTRVRFVPYRIGLAAAMQDLVAGQIDFMIDSAVQLAAAVAGREDQDLCRHGGCPIGRRAGHPDGRRGGLARARHIELVRTLRPQGYAKGCRRQAECRRQDRLGRCDRATAAVGSRTGGGAGRSAVAANTRAASPGRNREVVADHQSGRPQDRVTHASSERQVMQIARRKLLHLAAGAAGCCAVPRAPAAQAQGYPGKPVQIVVGYAAGGVNDILARLTGQWLSERLGQSFIVENKPGAGSNIATETVVRAPADGYTLLLVSAANAINATLYDRLGFNFMRDIAAVAGIGRVSNVMVVHPSFPARTLAEFIAYGKANPGKIAMASAGIGSPQHVGGELFKMMAGVDMVHVPYRGGAPALTDVIARQVDLYFASTASAIEYIKAGKVRAIAVTSTERSQALPDVPAIGDLVPGYEASAWYGVGAPRNTPAEIVETLHKEIDAGLADPKLRARLAEASAPRRSRARPPISASCSRTRPRSGARSSGSRASSRSERRSYRPCGSRRVSLVQRTSPPPFVRIGGTTDGWRGRTPRARRPRERSRRRAWPRDWRCLSSALRCSRATGRPQARRARS